MAGKMNDEMRNELIDEVTEWMADEVAFSTEFLRAHGETWLVPYSLDDLYEDYYCCDLKDTITAFIDSGCGCNDWYEYFVDDNGDLHDWDDVGEVVSEMVCDDSKYAEWCVEELEEGLITEPQELVDLFNKYAGVDWQDVQDVISKREYEYINVERSRVDESTLDMFVNDICLFVRAAHNIVEYLDKTHFCGIGESVYADVCDYYGGTDNAFSLMVDEIVITASNGITIEKATEMYVKKYWKKYWM